MKLISLLLLSVSLIGSESTHKSTLSGSRSTSYITQPHKVSRTLYNSDLIIISDGNPIYITITLDSVVQIHAKKLEISLKLSEGDKPLATKKVYVTW
jgi:hypothetical protein